MLHLRPRNRFEDLDGVYLVGGGTHPGSGLPVIYESCDFSAILARTRQPGPETPQSFAPDGLLARRPDEHDPYQFDDPMFGSDRWVSMLNPYELADGAPFVNGRVDGLWSADLAPIEIHGGVTEVEWNGRRVWTAVVEATENYASRCPAARSWSASTACGGWPRRTTG